MTNLDVAKMTGEEFFAAYESAKAKDTEKRPINTATLRIDEQVDRFEKNSFGADDEQAIFKDAMSI